jgi:L-aminopeptidase/D-esterase-like protein
MPALPAARPDEGALTDVAGLAVGHHTDARRPTGCTVVLADGDGAVAGVAQRGGSPGTRETDLLRPENTVGRVHAVLLTGGSAFGLDAAGGVMRWLEARGRGLRVGPSGHQPPICVPIVPAAVLFDLWVGDGRIRPDADAGWAACDAAGPGRAAEGSVGAGAGATVGKLLGWSRAMKCGIGQASLRLGGVTVAALVAANPIGDVRESDGRLIAGARREPDSLDLVDLDARLRDAATTTPAGPLPAGSATTIGVVATDARLDKAQATQLAALAHAGLARAISPLTPHDGDTLFALATGTAAAPADLVHLGALAAECVARAIRRAVWMAQGLPEPWVPSAADRAAAVR